MTKNYQNPYPIQKRAIPAVLNKKDVLGIVKTGSGKTASYIFPILINPQKETLKRRRHINVLVIGSDKGACGSGQ